MYESRREQAETYLLAGIGLVAGIGRYVLKPLVGDLAAMMKMPSQEELDEVIAASIQYYNTDQVPDNIIRGEE